MSDPRRMIETEDGLGGLLLASAHADAPSSAARSRAARALGIGAAASLGTAIGAGLAHGATKGMAASATAAATKGSLFAGLSVSKWLMVAALGGGTTLAASYGIEASNQRSSRQEASPSVHISTPLVAATGAQDVQTQEITPAPLPIAVPANEALGEAIVPSDEAMLASRAVTHKTPTTQAKTNVRRLGITEELALIEQARSESGLVSLETLALYSVRFPQGVLRPEALALEIVARRALGQRERATQLMDAFEEAYPRSPLIEGLQVSAGEAP